ncbi:MAG: TlpA disulfide reductase family protein [Bacteroidales bacterium]|nr:TlpA family protein disulfide reductase [Bacteroidales bacterium]MBS3773772.1 TlpA family protein disulfide reductase [Bacteroidales bacterium]
MKILLPIWFSMLLAAHVSAQKVPVYENFDDFQGILHQNNDTTYVINFWATYCAPCIEEMPAFRKLENHYEDQPVEIVLTSLDFGSNVKERVRSFMEKHNIQSRVVILDDPDANSWIDKVSDKWSGALPGTLIYNQNSREFYEKTFTYNELQQIVQSKMKEL